MAQTSKGKVIKAGFGYTVANYLIKGLAFLTIPIFSRLLSTTDYGLFNTYHAYESVFASFVGLALYMSLKNAKYRFGKEYHNYISSLLLINVIAFIAWEFLALTLYPIYKNAIGLSFSIVFILIIHCFCSSVLAYYNMYLSLSYSYKRYMIIAFVNAAANIVASIFLITTVFSGNRYVGRVLGTVIPLVPIAIYIVYQFWRKVRPRINLEYWKFGLKYSVPLIPHAVSQVIMNQFDRIMINNMVNASSAGIYSFAYNIYLIIEVTKGSLDNVWSAWFYEKYNSNDYDGIRKASSTYVLGMFCFVTIIILIAPELIKILGTNDYYDAAYLVAPICVAGFFSFLYSLPTQVEYYHEKTHYISIGTVAAALLNIVLNYFFIRKYGYIAAAYTTEFTYLIYFIIHYCIAKRIAGKDLFNGLYLLIVSIVIIMLGIISTLLVDEAMVRWLCIIPVVGIILRLVRKSGYVTAFIQTKLKK